MTVRSQDGAGIDAGIVVPLRSFSFGKARLSPVLSERERAALARAMAERVVGAAGTRPVAVVTSDPDVETWARGRGCDVVADPGSLDRAAAAGREWARTLGLLRYAVVHADLPLVRTFDAVTGAGAARLAVVVPDRHDDGTPVISLPADVPFAFAYGPGSAARHVAEAERHALAVEVLHDETLNFDVDVADDLDQLDALRRIGIS